MIPRARLVCPALRWRRGSFKSERTKIEQALAAGVGGFILFGGIRAAVTALTSALRDTAARPLLLGSDFERGPGQQIRGLTELPPPAALGYLNDLDATYACGQITGTEARAKILLSRSTTIALVLVVPWSIARIRSGMGKKLRNARVRKEDR